MKLAVDQIEASAATQVRVKIDQKIVKEYAGWIKAGAVFPPLICFAPKNSQRYILADGFHRLAAVKQIGRKTIGVEVREGCVHEALHFALGANEDHGLRRSNADKHHAVVLALDDPYYDEWSQRQISELCRVSHTTVQRIVDARQLAQSATDGTNKRPRKPKPTQAEVDLKELREALAVIKSFPYSGEGLAERLGLDPDDEQDINYCVAWLTEALRAHVDVVHTDPGNEITHRQDEFAP